MICADCLRLIGELERLERIHLEKRQSLREKEKTADSQSECSGFAVEAHDAKLDMVIARLELKRHQRNHPKFVASVQNSSRTGLQRTHTARLACE
jgi:hypothetical protein